MKYSFKVGDKIMCMEPLSEQYLKIGEVVKVTNPTIDVMYPGRTVPWIHMENPLVLAGEYIIDKVLNKYLDGRVD